MFCTERDGAAEVGSGVYVSQIALDYNFRVGLGELQDEPRQLAVANEKVGTSTKELIASPASFKQRNQFGDGCVLRDAKQIGGSSNAERGQFSHASAGADVDTEVREFGF